MQKKWREASEFPEYIASVSVGGINGARAQRLWPSIGAFLEDCYKNGVPRPAGINLNDTAPKKVDKADDKKVDEKADDKKVDEKKADEPKADEKRDDKKVDEKKEDVKADDKKADEKKADEKQPENK